jgi:hypothetical protein
MRNTLASIVAAAPGRNPQLPNTHKSHGCLELSQELVQFYFRYFPTCFSFSFSFLLLNPVFHQRKNSSPVVVVVLRRCSLVFFSHTHRESKRASKQATAAKHPHHTPHSSATPTYLGFSQIPHKTPQIPQQIPHTPEKASALYTGCCN